MKIALIGADGQLGFDLLNLLPTEKCRPLFYPDFDVREAQKTRDILQSLAPDVVINTAAFHRVDECEDRPEEALIVNAVAVRNLALICRERNAVLVHFSTDYVFDGRKRTPYVEEDEPAPLNVYGVSKLAGEYFVRSVCQKYFLIRTCGLYGSAGCREKGMNFVELMLHLEKSGRPLRVVDDQWVTPTSTEELAGRILELLGTERYGLYHMTNEGQCTWYEFAREIFSLVGRAANLSPIDSQAYGAKARRPAYSVLENQRAKALGITDFSPWREALKNYLKKKGLSLVG
ncbi:MAG: dTDP-4-dehydrorhamnose reductase [Candidatus Aminicenantes bacterium]|nr:dTDP-4-dehydrorhamnose reductase [Candidatus Aminicenantes bacterium]